MRGGLDENWQGITVKALDVTIIHLGCFNHIFGCLSCIIVTIIQGMLPKSFLESPLETQLLLYIKLLTASLADHAKPSELGTRDFIGL